MMETEDNKIDICPECGELDSLNEEIIDQQFEYGIKPNTIILMAENVPVMHCNKYNFMFTDYRGEEARFLAINTHQQK